MSAQSGVTGSVDLDRYIDRIPGGTSLLASVPVPAAEREAWLTRAEHDLAAMRAYADALERRFADLQVGCRALAAVRVQVAGALEGSGPNG
jgi:hypothetical protein